MCTCSCLAVHFFYLKLCITPSPRDSVYYEIIHTSTCFDKHLSLSLNSHKILFLALLNLLFSFLRIFLCLLFLPLYVLSFPTSAANIPPPSHSYFNSTQFHSIPQLFNFYFICIFITISILHLLILYLPSMSWHSRDPTETTTPQANTLALINSRANQDYCTQLMSSPFSYLHII